MKFNTLGVILFTFWMSHPAFAETCTDKLLWQQFKNDSQGQPDANKGKKKPCTPPPTAQTCKEVLAEPLLEGLDPKRWKACTEEQEERNKWNAFKQPAAKAPAAPVATANIPATPTAYCLFPEDQSPAPDWYCDAPFPDAIHVVGESKLGEKEARALGVKQFRDVVATHLMNMIQGYDETLGRDAAAKKKMTKLTKEAVANFPFEAKLETLAKTRSKGGVIYVAVGMPSARLEEIQNVLLKQILARYKKPG